VNCETDFVAKNDEFSTFVKNLAMHVAAARPLGIRREDIPEKVVQREEEVYRAQAIEMGRKVFQGIVSFGSTVREGSRHHDTGPDS
jgi:translation elongation factor EF-Ts